MALSFAATASTSTNHPGSTSWRVSWVIAHRQGALPGEVVDVAWKAQVRLCARFRKLSARDLNRSKITVATARELCGF